MSFAVSLATDFVSVDAGATHPISFGVSNKAEQPDHFEVLIEGLDPSWSTMPVESFTIEPGETQIQRLMIRVPREAESGAGTYPFVLRIRSLNSGDVQSVEAVLEVKPFHQLSLSVDQKRASMGGIRPEADFEVNVINLGNTEHELQLFASDPENECAFTFESEKLKLGPGMQRAVVMTASTRRRSFLSPAKLYGVSVSARSTTNPTLAAYTQAQLELKPVVSPAPFFSILAVALLAIAWFATIPRPPKIELFAADKRELTVGESATLNFQASGGRVSLFANDELLRTSAEEAGSFEFSPSDPGRYTLRLEVKRNDKTDMRSIQIDVRAPAELPKPEITRFEVNKRTLQVGEVLEIDFSVGPSVTNIEIKPFGFFPKTSDTSGRFTPNWLGAQDVTIIASNAAGVKIERSISVTVREAPRPTATIIRFNASTLKPIGPEAKVTVSWSLQNCVSAELEWNGVKTTVSPTGGTQELTVNQSGVVVLRGTDAQGKTVERRLTIEWAPTSEPPDDASPGGTTPPPASPTSAPTNLPSGQIL